MIRKSVFRKLTVRPTYVGTYFTLTLITESAVADAFTFSRLFPFTQILQPSPLGRIPKKERETERQREKAKNGNWAKE
jgi:hypothetical protein